MNNKSNKNNSEEPYINCLAQQWLDSKKKQATLWLVVALIAFLFMKGGIFVWPIIFWGYGNYIDYVTNKAIDASNKKK